MKKLFETKVIEDFTGYELSMFRLIESEGIKLYNKKRKEGFSTAEILIKIIDQLFKTDWVKLQEEYEEDGQMTFFDFKIGKVKFEFSDFQGKFYFNDNKSLYQYSESDKYNLKLTNKLKQKVKEYIVKNAAQFEYLINK